MLIKHRTRSSLASVVSVLAAASLVGIVPTRDADATKEQNDTDYSTVEEFKAQTPRLQLQTDQTMEQSSKALEEAIKQTRKESR